MSKKKNDLLDSFKFHLMMIERLVERRGPEYGKNFECSEEESAMLASRLQVALWKIEDGVILKKEG